MKCIICNREFDSENKKNGIVDAFCELCEEIREELTNGKGEE